MFHKDLSLDKLLKFSEGSIHIHGWTVKMVTQLMDNLLITGAETGYGTAVGLGMQFFLFPGTSPSS
jgi:hypothetical protein